jgi:pilus assembly protein TadC
VAAAVQGVAADARRRQQAEAHRRAARAGVLAVLPLGACFLPAFVLLGVVPAVVGLAGPLLHSLG